MAGSTGLEPATSGLTDGRRFLPQRTPANNNAELHADRVRRIRSRRLASATVRAQFGHSHVHANGDEAGWSVDAVASSTRKAVQAATSPVRRAELETNACQRGRLRPAAPVGNDFEILPSDMLLDPGGIRTSRCPSNPWNLWSRLTCTEASPDGRSKICRAVPTLPPRIGLGPWTAD